MPSANVNGIEIYFEEHGSGEPVLLIPASWWPSDTWKVGVVPVLSRRYRTIILDCRGTGRSSKPADGYTVTQFAADALSLLDHLGIKRCHAVGFALGSLIVQAMAIERPDLVATLTMAAAGPGSKKLDGTPRDLSPETVREIHEMGFEQYIRSHIDNDGMAYNPYFYRRHRDAAAALANALWSGQSTVEMFRLHEAARLSWDTLAEAGKITVPALILCGADDGIERRGSTPATTAKRLAAVTPGADLALIPGVRHMTFWDGDGALKALQDFLSRHPIGTT
jgi:pimeloyl-ACP methyl ester carboxylesterase